VDRIVYKIVLDGRPFAEGDLPVAESIPPSNETSFDIPSEIRPEEASREILDFLKRRRLVTSWKARCSWESSWFSVHGSVRSRSPIESWSARS